MARLSSGVYLRDIETRRIERRRSREGMSQPLYERYGFVPDGRIIEDQVVLRLDLAMPDRRSPRRAQEIARRA